MNKQEHERYDPKNTYDGKIEKRILRELNEIPQSITEVAKKARVQRITARKHLERLTQKGLAKEFKKPRTRLFVISQLNQLG